MQLALDEKTNDLILKEGGGVDRVRDGRYSIQQVRSALQTTLGEYYPNLDVGWLHLSDFSKNPDLYGIENRARERILGTQGVSSILSIDLSRTGRAYLLTFTAKTEYGDIDLSVPWSLGE